MTKFAVRRNSERAQSNDCTQAIKVIPQSGQHIFTKSDLRSVDNHLPRCHTALAAQPRAGFTESSLHMIIFNIIPPPSRINLPSQISVLKLAKHKLNLHAPLIQCGFLHLNKPTLRFIIENKE